jgi:hypothetical protein
MLHIRVTIVAVKTRFPWAVELQVTDHNLKILRVEQQCFMANFFADDSKT